MKPRIFIVIALALLCGAKAWAQEWEFSIENTCNDTVHPFNDAPWLKDPVPLSNGNCAVTYFYYYPGTGINYDYGSKHPGILLLSNSGEELTRKNYFKPSFWGYTPILLSDADENLYFLATYNPDHDSTTVNYFMNSDTPPDYSILGLYKIDDNLDVVEAYEHQIPIDTMSCDETDYGFSTQNDYSGSLHIFSAFVDNNSIVGGYFKSPTSDYHNPRGNDSVFFFRMGFDGNLIQRKGYEVIREGEWGGSTNWAAAYTGSPMTKTNDGFVFFDNNDLDIAFDAATDKKNGRMLNPGHAFFMDNDFNLIDIKLYEVRPGLPHNYFQYSTFAHSNRNTVYLSCSYHKNEHGATGCAIYEYDLDTNGANSLPMLHYAERDSHSQWDFTAQRQGVCVDTDNSLFFVYTLSDGYEGITIEHLHPNLDTIATLRYDYNPISMRCKQIVQSAALTKNGDLLLTFQTDGSQPNHLQRWSTVAKFPAGTFVGLDEQDGISIRPYAFWPTPTKDILRLEYSPDVTPTRIELYDLQGRLMRHQTSALESLDMEGLAAGTYTLCVTLEGGKAFSDKVVKE